MKAMLALGFALVLACGNTLDVAAVSPFSDGAAPDCNTLALTVIGVMVANNDDYLSANNQYDDFCIQTPANNHWYMDPNFDQNNSGSTTDVGDHYLFNCCVSSFRAINQNGAKMNVWLYNQINYGSDPLTFPSCVTIAGHSDVIFNHTGGLPDNRDKSLKIKWGSAVQDCGNY